MRFLFRLSAIWGLVCATSFLVHAQGEPPEGARSWNGRGAPAPAASGCVVSPTFLDFGAVRPTYARDLVFTITNTGSTPLSGTVTCICEYYWLERGSGPYLLDPGEVHEVKVSYYPQSAGVHTCVIETGNEACSDVICVGRTKGEVSNKRGKWALHFAGEHDTTANTCAFQIADCEEVIVQRPSAPGRYDIYVVAVDVDHISSTRFGLECGGPSPVYFYGWTKCSDLEDPTVAWPGCGESNTLAWTTVQLGPNVTMGILDVYVYGTSSLSTSIDTDVGFAEWCDGSTQMPYCYSARAPEAFSTVGFGVPGSIDCGEPPCAAPVPISPPNGSACAATEVFLDWEDVPEALSYEVQVDTSCASGAIEQSSTSEIVLSDLTQDTEYEWRVRALCPGGPGPWSGCSSFMVSSSLLPPGVPTLQYPPDGATNQPTAILLAWDRVPEAHVYEVQIGTSCGSGTIYNTSTSSKAVSGLDAGVEYCWRVRAKGACGANGEWSACWRFETMAQGYAVNSSGKWALHFAGAHNSKANTYSFQVGDCADVAVNAPPEAGHYDIYVIAADVERIAGSRYGLCCNGPFVFYGWTPYSDFEIWTPGWPGCGEGNAQTWSVEQAAPFVTLGMLDLYVYGSSSLSTCPDPRVGFAEFCDGSRPEPVCFSTTSSDAFGSVGFGMVGYRPCVVIPVELAGFEARAVDEGVLLEWRTSEVASFRHFFVSRSMVDVEGGYVRLHENPIEACSPVSGDYSYLDTEVIPGTLYFYKLEATDSRGASVSFGPCAAVAGQRRAQYWLGQNAPNPFRRGGRTTIHYSVPETGIVKIRILDAAGRLVKEITAEARPGDNSITWDGTDQSNRRVTGGVYFYQIDAGGFTAERKMLVTD